MEQYIIDKYNLWKSNENLDAELKQEIEEMSNNEEKIIDAE